MIRGGSTRRGFFTLAGAGLATARSDSAPQARPGNRPPNIVLITGDHLRWDHVAANGNPAIVTPHMDRIAREGVNFTQAQTVGVACAPNRASLFSGRYPNAHGVLRNGIKMPETEVTLTHILRENGWYTGQMGKLHFWPHAGGRNHREYHSPYAFHQMRLSDEPGCYDDAFGRWLDAQGPEVRRKANVPMPGERKAFDYYVFEGDERTTHAHWVGSETVRFIEESKDKPFFVHAGFYAPHPPLNPPQSMLDLYTNRRLPPRLYRNNEAKYAPPGVRKAMERLAGTPESTWTEYRKFFYAMVSNLDHNVGRILDALDRSGIGEHTIVVVTSDHGDYLGDHNLNSKSALPYDGSMHIPLLFRGPGVPRGAKVDGLCEIVDVMPTLLDLAGLTPPKGNQGLSLTAAMTGGRTKEFAYQESRDNRIVRDAKAKYCFWRNGEEILFDLEKDPDEFRNIAAEPAVRALKDEMRIALIRRSMEVLDPLPEIVAPY